MVQTDYHRVRARFEESYSAGTTSKGLSTKRIAQLAYRLRQGNVQTVSDLGAGNGEISIELAKRGFSVTAYDISETALDVLQQNATTKRVAINTRLQNIANIASLPTEPQGAFICINTFPFLKSEDRSALANYMRTHTLPNGYVAITGWKEDDEHPAGIDIQKELITPFGPWTIHHFSEEGGTLKDGTKVTKLEFLVQNRKPISHSFC
ncbi:hypothetical protein COV18_03390 [Candidatus Woesearchaeota archaeon CG10_big_fil_rev_8_21_14_0_10_37_12]|nr:MAG: hypothetical protein COV18_03390 [Candidatus Woesearchaeota archaeon CG10_big_fil_rev_8_21_14_0_10_37_12]